MKINFESMAQAEDCADKMTTMTLRDNPDVLFTYVAMDIEGRIDIFSEGLAEGSEEEIMAHRAGLKFYKEKFQKVEIKEEQLLALELTYDEIQEKLEASVEDVVFICERDGEREIGLTVIGTEEFMTDVEAILTHD